MYILLKQQTKGNNIYEFMRIYELMKMSLNYLIRKNFFRKKELLGCTEKMKIVCNQHFSP